jgi:hypothetical protein
VPDINLLQAFIIFLFLVRRHDSPRFVWMMVGLAIRMGTALGLQRDGSRFKHMKPYDVEMRRRLWWALCVLDIRASEDQGAEPSILTGTFDTKLPLNVNDVDIDPSVTAPVAARQGLTDATVALVTFEICYLTRRLVCPGPEDAGSTVDQQSQILNEVFQKIESLYFRDASQVADILYWVGVTTTRLVMSKMTLILYLPTLFFASSEDTSAEIRDKLFTAAIEVAEYNHALNSEPKCRHWRWLFQVYTQWHAIALLLMECGRRPWGPLAERAWVALHSRFLIPREADLDSRSLRAWIPLRRLMSKAKRHREDELERLRADTIARQRLESEHGVLEKRLTPISNPESAGLFLEGWRKLVYPQPVVEASAAPPQPPIQFHGPSPGSNSDGISPAASADYRMAMAGAAGSSAGSVGSGSQGLQPGSAHSPYVSSGTASMMHTPSAMPHFSNTAVSVPSSASTQLQTPPQVQGSQPDMRGGFLGWSAFVWADTEPGTDVFANMGDVDIGDVDADVDMNAEVDWHSWFESIRGLDAPDQQWQAGNQGW